MRMAIPTRTNLEITLRYLASSDSFRTLHQLRSEMNVIPPSRKTILFYYCSCKLDVEYSITVRMSHTFQELNYFVYIPPWGAHCIKI
jgi:hypothetical protein